MQNQLQCQTSKRVSVFLYKARRSLSEKRDKINTRCCQRFIYDTTSSTAHTYGLTLVSLGYIRMPTHSLDRRVVGSETIWPLNYSIHNQSVQTNIVCIK